MCLTIHSTDKNCVQQRIFYKVVVVSGNKMFAPIRSNYKYKPGLNIAKGRVAKTHIKEHRIESGAIHVFRKLDDAMKMASETYNEVVIPVICYKKDFIACDNVYRSDFAFKQVYITKEIYKKALKAEKGSLVS